MPDGWASIGQRLDVAARALAEDDWLPSHEVLQLGAAGLRVGTRQVPDQPVREILRLLAARLALHDGLPERADEALDTDGDDTAPLLALRSWAARLRRADGEAESLLAQARSLDPYDLDVTVESIARARMQQDVYGALDIARAAVAGNPSLGDVDGEMGRLVGPPPEIWVALAERARDDDEHDAARRLLDRAVAAPSRDDYVVLAAAEEIRAAVAGPTPSSAAPFCWPDTRSARAGRLDRARQNYEAAAGDGIPADPAGSSSAVARLRLADVIAVTARQQPRHVVADELQHALDLVEQARPIAGWIGAESWSYLTEAACAFSDPGCLVSDSETLQAGMGGAAGRRAGSV